MSKSVLDVRGIGQSTAAILAEHGIKSVQDLAGAKIEQLTTIQGFSDTRAAMVISDARTLLASLDTGENEKAKVKSKPEKTKKEKKSKKEKKRKDGKKKSSGKDKSKKKNKNKKKSKKESKKK